jgi:hypothetical protein
MCLAGVSDALQGVVFTALAKDKAQRYQTAGELARSFWDLAVAKR